MTVAFLDPGCRIGGITRRSDNLVTFSVITRANSDTTSVEVELSLFPSFSLILPGTYTSGTTDVNNNYQNVATFLGEITENSIVYWRVILNGVGGPLIGTGPSETGSFKSPPSKDLPRSWSIGAIGCTHLQRLSPGLPSNAYNTYLSRYMRDLNFDSIIHMGDTMYVESGLDTDPYTPLVSGQWKSISMDNATAVVIDDWRTDHITNLVYRKTLGHDYDFSDLMSDIPFYFIRDDHDVASAVNPAFGSETPGSWQEAARMLGMQALREFWYDLNKPLVEQEGRTYIRTWNTPEDWHYVDYYPVRFLYIDARSFHLFGKTDNSNKTLVDVLGADQEVWFKDRIDEFAAASRTDIPFLVIVSSIDLDGNHGFLMGGLSSDNWQPSSFPMNEMLNYIWDAGIGHVTAFVTGDTHASSIARYDSDRGYPSLYGFCLSNAIGINGHEQVTGWGGRLLGFDNSGNAAIGGVPVLNISGILGGNNLIKIDGGVDNDGPYLRMDAILTWYSGTASERAFPQSIFYKEYRVC